MAQRIAARYLQAIEGPAIRMLKQPLKDLISAVESGDDTRIKKAWSKVQPMFEKLHLQGK